MSNEKRKGGSYIPREMKFSLVLNSVNVHSLSAKKSFTMIIPPKYINITPFNNYKRKTLSGQVCGVSLVAEAVETCRTHPLTQQVGLHFPSEAYIFVTQIFY